MIDCALLIEYVKYLTVKINDMTIDAIELGADGRSIILKAGDQTETVRVSEKGEVLEFRFEGHPDFAGTVLKTEVFGEIN